MQSLRPIPRTGATPAVAGPVSRNRAPESVPSGPSGPAVRRLEEQLRRRLQTDVSIQQSGEGKGAVRIAFYSADDLDRLLDLILGMTRSDFD